MLLSNRSRILALTLALTLAGTYASADILFLDFNGSDTEIKVAQKVARSRGEKLHVLPEVSPEHRNAIAAQEHRIYLKESKLKKLNRRIYELQGTHVPQKLLDERHALAEEVHALKAERTRLANAAKVDTATLRKQLQDTVSQRLSSPITSLIISGHSNGAAYFGNFATVGPRTFKDLFSSVPELQSHLSGVYLWGCYSATRANTIAWKEKLPDADFFLGFHGQAPSNLTTGSPTLLESALSLEKSLASASTPRAAERALKAIKESAFYPLAALIHQNHVGIKIPTTAISAEDVSCAEEFAILDHEYRTVYLRNYEGRTPGGEVETSNSSELRRFYNRYQANQHCQQVVHELDVSVPQLLALLHPKQVMANFVERHRQGLRDLQRRLSQLPSGSFATGLIGRMFTGHLTRQELMSLNEELKKHLSIESLLDDDDSGEALVQPYATTSLLDEEQERMVDIFRKELVQLLCIPMSWIEYPVPGIEPEAPLCE